MIAAGPQNGFGIYVHWPYCARICPYCDFNVYAAKARDPAPLVRALITDLDAHRMILPDHPPATSLYFGGGTPSLLAAARLGELIDAATHWPGLTAHAEITLEANPNDILIADLEGWKAAGINRLSIGVQSLDAAALHFLGRDHDVDTARQAVARASQVFSSLSIDLIYARPGQTAEDWGIELNAALALGAPHISLYELTIAQKTAFGAALRRGELTPMPENAQADLYELTDAITNGAGWPAYEISNHARNTHARSVHNLTYWRSGDWIGLGPGAHGRLTLAGDRHETVAAPRPEDYIAKAQMGGPAWEKSAPMSAQDIAFEALAMGLRPVEGVDARPIEALLGAPLSPRAKNEFTENGLLTETHHRLALTPAGRLLADHITAELFEPA